MHVLVADTSAGSCSASLQTVPAVDAPPAAVTEPADLLHVDVDQLAGAGSFVASDHLTGGPVQPREPRHVVSGQDPVNRGGVHAQDRGDPGRAQAAIPTK